MQTTSQAAWDRRTIILTGTLWAVLFAGAWLLNHGSPSTSASSDAIAVDSGLSTPASGPGAAIPGLTAVAGTPGLIAMKPAVHPRPQRHARHATVTSRPAPRRLASAPVAPARRTSPVVSVTPVVRQPTTPVVSRPPVSRPTTPTTTPTHTNPPPTHPTTTPAPTGTGTVSGGG